MSWLLKRGVPFSRQGWRDEFNRPDENPIQQPWRQWGDSTSGRILSNKFRLDNNGWFDWSVGGWGPDYQPLTTHWGYEWQMDFLGTNPEGSFTVYLDKNWTRGQNQGTSKYSTYLTWTHDTTDDGNGNITHNYYMGVYHKDKDAIFSAKKDSWSTTQSVFFAPHVWKVDVFYDRVILVSMDGTPVLLYSIDDSNYLFSPDRRGINFRSNAWDTEIDWFYVYDNRGFPPTYTDLFYDGFNRANGSVGNGWSTFGSRASIISSSYAMEGGVFPPSDGGRAILRTLGLNNGRVAMRAIPGGNEGPSPHEQGMVLCSNSNGTQGLIARSTQTNAKLFRFSSALTNNPASYTSLGIFKDAIGGISSGNTLEFWVFDGNAYIWRGTELLAFANNAHAVVPASNPYMGLVVSRSAFINSGAWNDVVLCSLS